MKITYTLAAAGLLLGTALATSNQSLAQAGIVTGVTAPQATQAQVDATRAATQDAQKKADEAKKAAEEAAKKKQ